MSRGTATVTAPACGVSLTVKWGAAPAATLTLRREAGSANARIAKAQIHFVVESMLIVVIVSDCFDVAFLC